jgi:hypothetical protein
MASRKRPHDSKPETPTNGLNSSLEEIDIHNGSNSSQEEIHSNKSQKSPEQYLTNRPVSFAVCGDPRQTLLPRVKTENLC